MPKRGRQPGYTLVELLVSVAILGLVASAVVVVYQVSQQSYTRASSLEAVQLGARAGLDRMANELRLIGAYWVGATDAGNAIIAATPTSITFMANVDDATIVGSPSDQAPEALVASGFTATGTSVPVSLTATATTDAFRVYADATLNDYLYIANGVRREVKQTASLSGNTLTISSPLRWAPYPAGSLVRDVKRITYARNAADNTLARSQGGSGADTIVDNVTGLTFTYFLSDGVTPTTDAALIREIQIDLTVQNADGARRMTTRIKLRNLS